MSFKLYGGTKTVTTAGTRVALSTTDLLVSSVVFQGFDTNTGKIYIGGSDVLAASKNGAMVEAKGLFGFGDIEDSGEEDVINLKFVYIDSTVNSESVSFVYLKKD